MLLVLIQFPQLLQGGMYHRFQPALFFQDLLSTKPDNELSNQRLVTVLRPMTAPSDATIRKYLYDWDKKEGSAPPVRLRWGKEQLREILSENKPQVQKPREASKPPGPVPTGNEVSAAAQAAHAGGGTSPDNSSSGTSVVSAQNDPNRKGTVNLPPAAPVGPGKNETASNSAPSSIPNSVKPPSNTTANGSKGQNGSESMKVFENEQQALRSQQGGFFDTKGFVLDDYAEMIKARIKGKWFIPSNLRNSQGHTTVIFYIDKQGGLAGARIAGSSGSSSLDLAALNAILESFPVPPLPKGFPGDRVGAKFILSYNEPQSQ